MSNIMVDVDGKVSRLQETVAKQGVEIHGLTKTTDRLVEGINKMADAIAQLTNVHTELKIANQRVSDANHRHDETYKELKQLIKDQDEKITKNSQILWRFGGGITVFVFLVGIGLSAAKLF